MDGLPIVESCDGCGVCCMHMAVPPYDAGELLHLHQNEPQVYADYCAAKDSRLLQFMATEISDVPCGWFDMVTRKCRHYEHRPEVCKDYERGGWNCLSQRAKVRLWEPIGEQRKDIYLSQMRDAAEGSE